MHREKTMIFECKEHDVKDHGYGVFDVRVVGPNNTWFSLEVSIVNASFIAIQFQPVHMLHSCHAGTFGKSPGSSRTSLITMRPLIMRGPVWASSGIVDLRLRS